MTIQKKKNFFFLGGWGRGGGGASGRGVRVDVNREEKSFCQNSKKKLRGGGGRGRVGVRVGGVRSGVGVGEVG